MNAVLFLVPKLSASRLVTIEIDGDVEKFEGTSISGSISTQLRQGITYDGVLQINQA